MMPDIDKRYLWAAAVLLLLLVFAGGMKYEHMKNQANHEKEIITSSLVGQKEAQKKAQEEIIQVYVSGAVEKPGVYKLSSSARLYEALEMAQSLPTADLRSINLAQKLEDGQAIVVPNVGEEIPASVSSGGSSTAIASTKSNSKGKVNINSASAQELDQLPGIGPTLAQRIVEYRNQNGIFASIEELNEVSGIGDKKFADLKDLITVR